METSLPRLRGIVVSAQAFRRLALANALMLLVIVASGATVRLTASGLGCPHWPGCEAPTQLPEKGYHSFIEFGNRLVAAVTIFLTLATLLAAFWTPTLSRWTRWVAVATFVGTLGQAPLGAITVYYHLNPWLVLSHFLVSMTILTLGVIVALEGWKVRGDALPLRLRQLGLLVGVAGAALIVSGTFATAAGRFPGSFGSVPVQRLGQFYPAMWLHVRAVAVFGISFLVLLVWLTRAKSRFAIPAVLVLCLLGVQMAVGEIQYRVEMVWWLVLIHVSLAATLWGALSALVASLWRPDASKIA
jgi:cytochrome c oxidase assembly protein subunit 15